jgi:hypothetical protein
VFRSKLRELIFSQAEHARLAGIIAGYWGNETLGEPPLPRESFVRGVMIHDRGYGELDDLGIGEVETDTWLDIQRRGIQLRSADATADAVALMRLRRLLLRAEGDQAKELQELAESRIAERVKESGHPMEAFERADSITATCDMISFRLCFEEPMDFSQIIRTPDGAWELQIHVTTGQRVILDPWPLSAPEIRGGITAYQAAGYPRELEPVLVPYSIGAR